MEKLDRRNLGRFDTPAALSEAVVKWAVRTSSDTVLEPSAGSGVFVASILDQLHGLGNRTPKRQVWACDIDPSACQETAALTGLHTDHIINADFLSLVDVDGLRAMKFNCIVGNPPYVSLHRMSPRQRELARTLADNLGFAIDDRASLWSFFVVASLYCLELGGRLAFVLPEATLHADYARKLVKSVCSLFGQSLLLSIRERCFVSDGASERVVLLLCDDYSGGQMERSVLMNEQESLADAISFLSEWQERPRANMPELNGHAVPHLLPNAATGVINLDVPLSHRLGDFVAIRIGVVTGANKFYLFSEQDRTKRRIPLNAVVPVIPRFSSCEGLVFGREDWEEVAASGSACWMLLPKEGESRRTVLKYLESFPVEERLSNRTFQKRKPWFIPQVGIQPDAFLRYMGAHGPRMTLADYDVTCTNSVHRLTFKPRTARTLKRAIALSLHSSYSQLSAEFEGRCYGSGVLKLEPSEASRVRLLLPSTLDTATIDRVFQQVDRAIRTFGYEAATKMVDAWLYTAIPTLHNSLPRQRVSEWLRAAIKRRVGTTSAGRALEAIEVT